MLIWVLQSSHCFKIRVAQHLGRRGANLSENEGVNSECKKFGENSRQMAPVSTFCDEYCSFSKYLDRSKSHFTDMLNNLPSSLLEKHGKEAWTKIKKFLSDADAQRVFTERLPEKSNCNEPRDF